MSEAPNPSRAIADSESAAGVSPNIDIVSDLARSLNTVIRGKEQAIDSLIIALLAGGHVLLEDVPGVGKTTLALTLARSLDLAFGRVQFTPDLMPSDIIGSQVLDPRTGEFTFHAGPLFTQVFLADEINRASPRTQSALLEAMNESQVSLDGRTLALEAPFFVIATQNPIDFQGTYPLPEAQLDRFLIAIEIGYPDRQSELDLLFDRQRVDPIDAVTPVASASDLILLQQRVRQIRVDVAVAEYLLELVARSRKHPKLELGISPRGTLSCFRAAQARALIRGRDYVTPDDIQQLAEPVIAHRLRPAAVERYGGKSPKSILRDIIESVPIPL